MVKIHLLLITLAEPAQLRQALANVCLLTTSLLIGSAAYRGSVRAAIPSGRGLAFARYIRFLITSQVACPDHLRSPGGRSYVSRNPHVGPVLRVSRRIGRNLQHDHLQSREEHGHHWAKAATCPRRVSGTPYSGEISKMVSTSTATSPGNACIPTAERAWIPFSPKTS